MYVKPALSVNVSITYLKVIALLKAEPKLIDISK